MPRKRKWQIVVPEDFETTKSEYKLNGRSYHRVTSTLGVIAKHRLFNWAKRVGEAKVKKILETRQAIGIHVHKLIELTLQNTDFNLGAYETEIQEGMTQFNIFKVVSGLNPDGLEQRLWSNTYGYAGTADYIGKYKSPVKFLTRGHIPKFEKTAYMILDWKTSKSFYPSYWLQLAAYMFAFHELTGIWVDGGAVIRIRDGKLKVQEKTRAELKELFKVYQAVLVVYKWKFRIQDDF